VVVATIMGLGLEEVEVDTMGDIMLLEDEEEDEEPTCAPFPVAVVSSLENTPGIIYKKNL
jgi:hypothetical protein